MNLFRDREEILEGERLLIIYKTKKEANEAIVDLMKAGRRLEANNIKDNYPWSIAPSGYPFVEIKHDELLWHPSRWNMKRS